MDEAELRRLLNDGIAAIRAGDRARGRDLLLRVVAADERSEPAWLWLSAAVDDPEDQLTALENVLTLNPNHAQARAGAEQLRQRLRPLPPPESPPAATATGQTVGGVEALVSGAAPADASDSGAAAPAVELYEPDDDPLQCAYCGRLTGEDDERCPHCGRSLLAPGLWRGSGYQYVLLILCGLQVQWAMAQCAAAYVRVFLPDSLSIVPGAEAAAASPLIAATIRLVLWAILLMMLLGDSRTAYRWAALAAAADLAWQGAGFGLGLVGKEVALLNGLFGGFIGLLGLSATIGQAQSQRRLRVLPDRGISSGPLYAERARQYARRGMWALAAVHWQKAIARQPREPAYYKALGAAQVQLGRHAQAVKTFRSGADLAPDDPEFARLIQSVRASARSS